MSQHGQSRRATAFRPAIETLEDRWVPANVGSANQNFIDQLYRDLLHRAPDPGSAGWVESLNGGEDRAEVIEDILDSPEGRQVQVNDLYLRFLGREADASGLAFWSNYLQDNSNIELASNLIASDEYYQTQGDGTNFGFLNAAYQDILGRPISAQEFEDRHDDFDDGAEGRAEIIEDIFDSDEAEFKEAAISAQSFLGTTNVTADQIDDIADDDDDDFVFATSVLESDAYYARAQTLPTTSFAPIPGYPPIDPLTGLAFTPGTTGTTTGTTGTTTTTTGTTGTTPTTGTTTTTLTPTA